MPFSFPGGKCDPTDRDVVHTALRETHEELGLVVPEEHVWGVLQPVYDQVSLPGPEAPTSPYPLHPSACPGLGAGTPRDKGVVMDSCHMVEPRIPAWQLCSILTQPSGTGPGVYCPPFSGYTEAQVLG